MPADTARWLDLLLQANVLKTTPRTGWHLRWVPDPENVAAHSWGTAMVALVLAEMSDVELDRGRMLTMAMLHDLAETEVSDIPRMAKQFLPEEAKNESEAHVLVDVAVVQGVRGAELREPRPVAVAGEVLGAGSIALLDGRHAAPDVHERHRPVNVVSSEMSLGQTERHDAERDAREGKEYPRETPPPEEPEHQVVQRAPLYLAKELGRHDADHQIPRRHVGLVRVIQTIAGGPGSVNSLMAVMPPRLCE